MLRQGAVAVAVVTAVAIVTAPVAAAADQVVLSVGHVDAVDVHYTNGALSLAVHDDTVQPPVTRDPVNVTFQVLPGAAVLVPDIPEYGFLGAPGTTVWVLPQIQDPNLLWPGYNTEELSSGTFADDQVQLTMVSVAGPGAVATFTVDPFGNPNVQWNSANGTPDTIDVPVGTHAHTNWAFGAEGSYTVTFRADATLAGGGTVTTGLVPYRFVVGELGPDPELTLTVQGMLPSYRPGGQVSVTAVPSPATELDRYRWFTNCPGSPDWSVIPGEEVAGYSFTAVAALNGCRYLARLYHDDDTEAAASEPVTLVIAAEPAPDLSQLILATLDASQGALVVSIDPDDRTVVMPVLRLGGAGDRWESRGELRPVTVTDTRPGRPGWNVSGQIGDFTAGESVRFGGRYLGWTPTVLSQANGQLVSAGQQVPTGFLVGDGLSGGALLGTAPTGGGIGTARLGAGLLLELPTQTAAGAYAGTLTITAI